MRIRMLQMMKRVTTGLLVLFAVLSAGRLARAADRTVCYEVRIRMHPSIDNFTSAADTGERRATQAGAYVAAIGQVVEVWDKDPGSNPDDLIGTWVIGNSGVRCVTFPYEGQPYAEGDANPDVYIKLKLESRNTNGVGPKLQAIQDNGTDFPSYSFRGANDDDDVYVYNNCPTGVECRIYPAGYMAPALGDESAQAAALRNLDFGQRMLQVYGGTLGTATILLEIAGTNTCNGQIAPACTPDANNIQMNTSQDLNGLVVTHELGHILQLRMYDLGGAEIDPDYGADNTWNWNSNENASTATAEGWAEYVAAVSWWNPGGPNNAHLEDDENIENADPLSGTCSSNAGKPGQVAKAFWDLDDFPNEALDSPATAADNQNVGTTTMAHIWEQLPAVTSNGGSLEPNPNGRNMWDYWRAEFALGSNFIYHNCLENQVN
jgi:hypothetical protein